MRKKIILGMLVLGICVTGITQAYNDQNGRAYGYINAGETQTLPNKGTINGLTQQENFTKKSFVNYFNNERGEYVIGYIIKNDTFYFVHGIANRQANKQGYLTKRQVCNGTGYKGEEGMFYNYCDEERTNIDLTLINQVDQVQYYNFMTENNSHATLCLIDNSQGKSYCLSCGYNGCPSTTNGNGLLFDETNYSNREYRESQGENAPRIRNSGGNSSGSTTSGATLYCPPIKYEISMYGSKFNTGLCYSNTEEISGGQVITVTPISIFDAFPTYQNYVQAYNIITNNCHTSTVNTQQQCQEALQGIGKKPAQILLKLINSNIQEGVSLSKIYQYCHLQLDYTEEEKREKSTCDLKEEGTYYASGVNNTTQSNPNPLQGMTEALQNNTEIVIPEDGTIFDTILPDGILTRKDVIFDFDFWKHLTKLIGKMTTLFKVRPIQTGILPPLITSLLLLVILFKIYKK